MISGKYPTLVKKLIEMKEKRTFNPFWATHMSIVVNMKHFFKKKNCAKLKTYIERSNQAWKTCYFFSLIFK